MKHNKNFKKSGSSFLRFFCQTLLCIPLLAMANQFDSKETITLLGKDMQDPTFTPQVADEMKLLLNDHIDEWNNIKPMKSRVIKLESNLEKIITALDKVAVESNQAQKKSRPVVKITSEPTKTVKIGVHLASYKEKGNIQNGWNLLEHNFAGQLKGRVPLYYQAKVKDILYTRLVVGDFDSQSAALQVCKSLESKGQYCHVTNYRIANKKA